MAAEPQTPTPSRDLDVFGKELPLTTAEKQILTGEQAIFLKKTLSIDIIAKKGDLTEPRILVISSSKCFILSHRPTTKLETSFNFLRIQKVECTENTLTFLLAREQRPMRFHLDKKDSIEILGLITAQLKNVFPITPLDMVMQMTFTPSSLRDEVFRLRDSLLSAMDRVDATSIHGFITAYAFICDFFGVPFNEEVSWYLKNIYLPHGFKDLKLTDFSHLASKDLRPVLSALRHNEFFEGFVERDNKMDPDLLEEVGYVLNASRSMKKLTLHNCSLRPENVVRLSAALKNNPRPSLTYLDLSHNPLDDRTVEALGSALESLSHGLHELLLANCKITARAATQLANNMVANKFMQHSLVHLDLSANPLGSDPQGALRFLKDPQTVATLNLSSCGLNFEFVIPVLIRGCQQHLRELDLSHNRTKKGSHGHSVGAHLQQFCSSAISIATINLSGCKLSSDIVVGMLEGLGVNPNVQSIDLNLSGNDLGSGKTPENVAIVIGRTRCLNRLDVSESGIDNCLVPYVAAAKSNTTIRHLNIGKNFNGKGNSRPAALKALVDFLADPSCQLESLCLADSHLREQTSAVLEAVANNDSLTTLDIGGNTMGNRGARSLARTLLSNCSLRTVLWDRNDTTLCGLRDVASSMEHNYTLQVMPLPLHDISRAAPREPEVEEVVQKMQVFLCRNHSDERLKIELAARHRQRLLTATQQSAVVSRELVQLDDLLQWAERNLQEEEDTIAEAILIREEANMVVQLTDGLYSPHVESEQFESVTSQVQGLLDGLMERLHKEHVQENSQLMVTQTVKACPNLLSDKDHSSLKKLVVTKIGSDFDVARKTVVRKAVPEIINPISAINLDLAATISERLVEKTLAKLEKINSKLIKLQKALQKKTSGATPDQKVSRKFTFRAEGEDQPKVKRKRPLSADSDIVELPSSPLQTDAPQLEHVNKGRPKPARLQKGGGRRPHKPAHLTRAKEDVDVGEFVKAVKEAEENAARLAAEEEKKAKAPAAQNGPVEVVTAAKTEQPKTVDKELEKEAKKKEVEEKGKEKEEGKEKEKKEEEEEGEKEEVKEKKEPMKPPMKPPKTPPQPRPVSKPEEEKKEEEKKEEDEEGEKEKEKEVKEKKEPIKPPMRPPKTPPQPRPVSEPEEEKKEEKEEGEKEKEEEEVKEKKEPVKPPKTPPLPRPVSEPEPEPESALSTPSPPPTPSSPLSPPPPLTSPSEKEEDVTSDNVEESTSSAEVQVAAKEGSLSPAEEGTPSKRDRKSRKMTKKEEKERERERKEKEKEEKEREKKEREEKERLRKEREKEEKERERKEKEEKERLKKEKEREEKEREKKEKEEKERLKKEKEREEKERERREKEERERERKEKEKEEKEKLKREQEERERLKKEKEKEEKEKEKKRPETPHKDDHLAVEPRAGTPDRESSPSESHPVERRKAKSMKERKKGGLSKLFGRPRSKEEEEAPNEPDTADSEEVQPQPQPSPRRQTTPTKRREAAPEPSPRKETPEIMKRVPPKIKDKPQKSMSLDFGLELGREEGPNQGEGEGGGGAGEGAEKKRIPVGGVALGQLAGAQLASVLKQGRPSPQPRPKVPPPSSSGDSSPALSERTASDSAHQSPSTAHKTPPVAPRPRPKPRPRKAVSSIEMKKPEELSEALADQEKPAKPQPPKPVKPEKPKKAPKPASRSSTPVVPPEPGAKEGEEEEEKKGGGDEKEKGRQEGEEGEKKGGSKEEERGEEGGGKEKSKDKEEEEEQATEDPLPPTAEDTPAGKQPEPTDSQEASKGTSPSGAGEDKADEGSDLPREPSQTLV